MKRFLALVGLMIVCAGPVAADYLIIKIDLNKVNFSNDAPAGGQPGAQPGDQPGFQPGAQPGAQPGGFPGGGFGGMGAMGGKGMMGKGKGGGGALGGFPPGGGVGGLQQPPGGQPGAVPPGAGQLGGVEQGAGQPGAQANDVPPHWILAAIEFKSTPMMLQARGGQGPRVLEADHLWGKKGRFPEAPGLVDYIIIRKDSVAKEFSKKYGKVVADGKEAGVLYYAASWALAHGLTKEFHNAMAALAKADPNHFAVANYNRVQADLKKAPGADDPATQSIIGDLRDEKFQLNPSDNGHYGVLAKSASPIANAAMKRRLARFETAFDNFFYWFALQENVQPPAMPKYRLYAVLVEDKERFHALHSQWSRQPMITDGFTPRRDNLIVLSAKRLDENYVVFEKNVQNLWTRGINREELVSGAIWDRKEAKSDVSIFSAYQTLALMLKSLDEDSERASISHEATRQLLLATGILPRLVNVPEWIQSGMASYLDTPYGALYNGVGLPSWSNLVAFKHFRRANKLGGSPYEALQQTISSKFFRDVVRADEDQKDRLEKETKELKDAHDIAHSTAWALVYYIIHEEKKLPQLLRYTQELANLPRDLDLDERTLQACFARAFDLTDAKDARRLDPEKGRVFANAWFSRMLEISLEVPEAERELTAYRFPVPAKKGATTPSGQPGGFGVPGGANPGLLPGGNPNPNAPPGLPPGGGGGGPRGG